ncbi:MAG: glycosyltransferase [Chlamydiales bacterium]|nr:glycosyltransferase [Chlamydiia bacterium]MCP5507376.1 glycosyltransferase [Chlamydiales bacterium]
MSSESVAMLNRVDIFMPPRSQYGVLHHFTRKMHEAMERVGVSSRLMEAQYDNPRPFLEQIFGDRPQCTLSFNGLLPDEEGRFFCDLIQTPHVACLVDSPNHFFSLIKSPFTIITCIDRNWCDFFRGMNCKNVFFMPHGVERELKPDRAVEKVYDVVMLNSCIDYEAIRSEWSNKYPNVARQAMEEAAEMTLSDLKISYVQAFVDAMDRLIKEHGAIDAREVNFIAILDDLEMYIKGKSRVDLLRAVTDAEVHVYGASTGEAGWEDYLAGQSNIVVHEAVPYEQALEVVMQSKILLNSSPWIKDGSHERILAGMALEALVFTNENVYLKEQFSDGDNVAFYKLEQMGRVNQKVNEYLSDNGRREAVAKRGRETVMAHHTWDHRAKQLLGEITPVVKELNGQVKQ